MNIFDIIILIILSYGLINGFVKGFIIEVAGIISLILGVTGSFKFASILEVYLNSYVDWRPKTIQAASFIILFVIIIYAVSLLAKMITKTLKIIALGMINRIFGGIFGLLKWCIILSSLVLVSQEINEIITLIPDKTLKESISYNLLEKVGGFLFDWVMKSKNVQVEQFIL
jgi:membrane protein required for colicin V production